MTWGAGTGGDSVFDEIDGAGVTWRYHKFTTVGSSTFTATSAGDVEYLIVAGGGGSGGSAGGGGGGGGMLFGATNILAQNYTVVIGSGGAGGGTTSRGANGQNSSAFSFTAIGGGGGGAGQTQTSGSNGGSGGGAGAPNVAAGTGTEGPPRQGFDGGTALRPAGGPAISGGLGGGGGGANDYGKQAIEQPTNISQAGNGGDGREWPIGSGDFYAGGGGGGHALSSSTIGLGGIGGGGNGNEVSSSTPAQAGTNGTGGGGGGGQSIGTAGGSGIVIIRYVISGTVPAPSPTHIEATGGEIADQIIDGVTWRYHTFPAGQWAFNVTAAPFFANEIEYLIVAGGGGGGPGAGGGGGGGGMLFGTTTVSEQLYTITTGLGGTRARGTGRGGNGQNSSGFSITAIGGGGGGQGATSATTTAGSNGGSGGGSGRSTWNAGSGVAGPPRQGFGGGKGRDNRPRSGGGGGGAHDYGRNGNLFNGVDSGGDGGSGREWLGTPGEFYAGGGGGGGISTHGTGGVGGGGNGGSPGIQGVDGRGGGGGGSTGTNIFSGRGGNGIVIVRYIISGIPPSQPTRLVATGGQVYDQEENGTTYRYHKFVVDGIHAFRLLSNPDPDLSVEYLIVAGGGGAAGAAGGGGGAGGALTGTEIITVGDYDITIGIGGAGVRTGRGGAGAGSELFGVTVTGGGGGGATTTTGGNGGSGGGSARSNIAAGTGIDGPPRQGFDGGRGRITSDSDAGGGGGAGGPGLNGTSSPSTAGDGGVGIEWPAESNEYYAGGGGGGGVNAHGIGGLGGGGNGGSPGSQGVDGKGGGGGGATGGAGFRGGRGGSGVAVLRYILPPEGPTPPTVTTGVATEVTKTSAKLSGSLDNDGGETATFGFAVATAADNDAVFFISDTLGTEIGTYELTVENLNAGTTYFFRAFALSGEGPGFGDWVSFTTEAGDPPTVFNAGVDFGGTFAEFAGLITDQGEGPVTGRGFVYNVAPDPVIGQEGAINVPAGSGVGGFSTRVSGLDPEVTYYWRAYGTNVEAGTAYADTESFTTTVAGAPEQLSLTMTTVNEDTIPSVGTARFQTDPEDTGTYTWEIAGEVEPPYFGGVILNAVVDGVPAGQVIFPDGQFGETVAIQFTPAPNWFGQLTFSYRVSNGFAFSDWEQATVTVNPVPDPPGPVVGNFPDFDEDTTATFDLTWTDVDDLPPGTLVASPNYFLQMRPTAGGAWRWLTEGSPTARLTNVAVRVLNYSSTELRGTFRVEPDANYYGPYGAQVRIAKKLENDTYLFGPARNLAGTIAPVPDAPTRPQPNRMPTAKVGQTVSGRFTTFDPDIEDTSWLFEISAPGADTWGSSLVIPDVGTLTVIDTDLADQAAQVQLVQETGGATDLRYQFDLRVTDSSGLISPVQRVTGLITLPTATVFLQKVTRSSPAVVTPLTPLVEVFDLNVTDSIDGIGGADVTVSTDEVRRRAAQLGITAAELLEPGTVELVVAIGTQLVFVGPVGEVEWSATRDRINITARGLLSYLEERRIGAGTKSFVGEDIADIMWTLVDDAQGQSFGDYSFTDNTTAAGTNLTVEFEERIRILEALRSLARADGGPDFWIDPERRFNTATARGQDRRDIIRLTPGMMEGATWTNRDEQLATVVTVIGGEDGMGGFFQGTAVTTDSAALAKYGRREKLLEVPELTTNQQCEDYAARVVSEQARRSETIRLDIVVTPDRPFSIRDLEVGDILTVDLRAPDLGQVIGAYRVVNRRLNLVSETADSYRVRLDLVPAPFINSALVKVKARHNASIVERLAQLNSQQE